MKNISDPIKLNNGKYEPEIDSITYDFLNAPVSLEDIEIAGLMLKTNKAAGSDSIPAEFYNYNGGILAEHFQFLLTVS